MSRSRISAVCSIRAWEIHGGVVPGMGQALCERVVYDRGTAQLLTGTFMDYATPGASDLADVVIAMREVPTKINALGAKGVGQAGTIGALGRHERLLPRPCPAGGAPSRHAGDTGSRLVRDQYRQPALTGIFRKWRMGRPVRANSLRTVWAVEPRALKCVQAFQSRLTRRHFKCRYSTIFQ
jgi:hypothetical protein